MYGGDVTCWYNACGLKLFVYVYIYIYMCMWFKPNFVP
jgi:hypothetical protein